MALTIGENSGLYRLLAQLNRTNAEREITLARLSSGKKINRGSDDPAGLIALKSLESELTSVNAAIDNNQRTKAMLDVADGALLEVSSLLSDIEQLAVESAGTTLSASEKAANQAQIDSALDAIDRIVNDATFNGTRLFGGEHRITTTMTAADAADLKDVRVYNRRPGSGSTSVTVNVTAAATRATTSGTVVANITAALSAETVVTITGANGNATVTLASGSSLASVVSTINDSKGLTGVSATSSGTQLKLTSIDYGTEAFITVAAISGDQDVLATANVGKTTGTDATVLVNGQSALTSGTEIYYNGDGISLSANLVSNTTGSRTITITGGGATFQLGTDSSTRATLGLNEPNSYSLGRSDLGYLSDLRSGGSASVAIDASAAVTIAQKAVSQVANMSGRVGGFIKYSVDPSINSLTAAQEGLTASISDIGDTDFAVETAKLERQNLLANAAISLLSIMNSQQQNLLALLR